MRAPGALQKLELPVLPEVTHRVWAAIDRPDGDARTLAGLIRTDAAFAGHLLRIANSPAYASRAPITSLQQAVSRLGFRTLGEIAVIIACKTRAFQVKGHEAEVRDLFRHSLATALLAREVARMRRLDVENAFVAGLLHDVGRPTLIQALVDEHARCDGERAAPLSADDFETVVTVLHEEIGAEIVAAWGLPPRLATSVRHHHDPDAAGDARADAALLSFADALAHLAMGDLDLGRDVAIAELRSHPATLALNLYPEDVEALLARSPDIVAGAEALL